MKTIFGLIGAVALCTTALANGATDAVLAAERAREQACLRADAPALAAVLSDELLYVHSTGRQETKAAALADLAEGRVVYRRFETFDVRARQIAADVVVLSGRIEQEKISRGKPADANLLFLAVWRREGEAWRLVAFQSALPPVR